ncbi:E3 ubiquitin ligase RBR family [Trema orientale]|uniref:RBR-type E3 ubiquitin transferase n=1 Tax=Trema orientale TaxID=63057 RepID=A0A2P5DYC2_TREOI|nr:E3 ubiquitin ligase RBR family [Trema orientale]
MSSSSSSGINSCMDQNTKAKRLKEKEQTKSTKWEIIGRSCRKGLSLVLSLSGITFIWKIGRSCWEGLLSLFGICNYDKKTKLGGSRSKGNELEKTVEENDQKHLIVFCDICMDMKTETEMFWSSDCSHSYCLVCIGSHVAAKIGQNIINVKCPDLGCKSFLDPQNCAVFIPRQVLDRWEAALCESVLGSNKIYCPFKDCSALLVDDGNGVLTSAECPHCHGLFCARCKVPWHAGSKCKSYKTGTQDETADNNFIALAKREKWQKCPACGFYVQKIQGCKHIKCR